VPVVEGRRKRIASITNHPKIAADRLPTKPKYEVDATPTKRFLRGFMLLR
jgi:hypothetical protein